MRVLRPLLLLVVLGTTLILGVPGAAARTETYGAASFHPFTLTLSGGCIPDPDHAGTRDCDPVDLIFPDRTWQQVSTALKANGWNAGTGGTQYLHFGDTTLVPQDTQLFYPDRGGKRYHIRLWQVRGLSGAPVTVGAVHHEIREKFNDLIDTAWDDAEAFVRQQFCAASPGACTTEFLEQQDALQRTLVSDTDNNPETWRGWGNDRCATVIPATLV